MQSLVPSPLFPNCYRKNPITPLQPFKQSSERCVHSFIYLFQITWQRTLVTFISRPKPDDRFAQKQSFNTDITELQQRNADSV